PLALIPLGLPHPAPQRLGRAADLLRDGLDGGPLGRVLLLVLPHQPDRPLPDLCRIPLRSPHDPNLSRVGASDNPGAVQSAESRIEPWFALRMRSALAVGPLEPEARTREE